MDACEEMGAGWSQHDCLQTQPSEEAKQIGKLQDKLNTTGVFYSNNHKACCINIIFYLYVRGNLQSFRLRTEMID